MTATPQPIIIHAPKSSYQVQLGHPAETAQTSTPDSALAVQLMKVTTGTYYFFQHMMSQHYILTITLCVAYLSLMYHISTLARA